MVKGQRAKKQMKMENMTSIVPEDKDVNMTGIQVVPEDKDVDMTIIVSEDKGKNMMSIAPGGKDKVMAHFAFEKDDETDFWAEGVWHSEDESESQEDAEE